MLHHGRTMARATTAAPAAVVTAPASRRHGTGASARTSGGLAGLGASTLIAAILRGTAAAVKGRPVPIPVFRTWRSIVPSQAGEECVDGRPARGEAASWSSARTISSAASFTAARTMCASASTWPAGTRPSAASRRRAARTPPSWAWRSSSSRPRAHPTAAGGSMIAMRWIAGSSAISSHAWHPARRSASASPRRRRRRHAGDLGQRAVQDGVEQGLLAVEVVVQATPGHAGLVHDRIDRGRLVPAPPKRAPTATSRSRVALPLSCAGPSSRSLTAVDRPLVR